MLLFATKRIREEKYLSDTITAVIGVCQISILAPFFFQKCYLEGTFS
jgi:hypothetical protein